MAQDNGFAAADSSAPQSASEVDRLRSRLLQARDALETAARALSEAQLAVARALDTPTT